MRVSRSALQSFSRGAARAAALAALLSLTCAHAELGGAIAAPGAGTAATSAGAAAAPLLNGAVLRRTNVDAGGTTINEYASNTGEIFAYTWQGPTMPDLPALLGAYDASYRSGATAGFPAAHDLHASRVVQPDVVVESGGQMRSYVGRAWLPGALPAGVTPDDLP
jgi:hypothetical protein